MARRVSPEAGETLAAFLNRLLELRKMSANELARRLAANDDRSEKSTTRTVRRWVAGKTSSISQDNATALEAVLTADFARFVSSRGEVRDLLTEALSRLGDLEKRVEALEP